MRFINSMNIYLDTSLLIPIYIPEIYTEKILSYLNGPISKISISRLTETEFCSALAIKTREKQLTIKQASSILHNLAEDINSLIYEKIYISDEIFQKAIDFLATHETNLRTLDALHLGCAALIEATLVTSDRALAKAAKHFNVSVECLV